MRGMLASFLIGIGPAKLFKNQCLRLMVQQCVVGLAHF